MLGRIKQHICNVQCLPTSTAPMRFSSRPSAGGWWVSLHHITWGTVRVYDGVHQRQ